MRFRLTALFAAQFFDLGTFSLMVDRHGVVAEANPIVAQGFADWGMPLVVVAKIALVLLVGSIVVLLTEHQKRRTTLGLAAFVVGRGRGRGIRRRGVESRRRSSAGQPCVTTRPVAAGPRARSPGGRPGPR